MALAEVMREVGKMWKEVSDKVKAEYQERADALSADLIEEKASKPKKIVMPASAFSLWTRENRKEILKENPEVGKEDVKKLLKEKWAALDKDVRIEYENRFHEMKLEKLREE